MTYLIIAQVETLRRNSDLQPNITLSECTAIYVFVHPHDRVVQLWTCHHGGNESLYHLYSYSINSGMLHSKQGSLV